MNAEPAALTAAQSRALDAALGERVGVPSLLLMENAGRGAAEQIDRRYGAATRPTTAPPRAVLLCGPGNNGGDGFVVARHLLGRGWQVVVATVDGATPRRGDSAVMQSIVTRLAPPVPLHPIADAAAARAFVASLRGDDVVIDALLGTGTSGAPREPIASLLRALQTRCSAGPASDAPRALVALVALDLPSGLDADRGDAAAETPTVALTLTFAARKVGFAIGDGPRRCGEVVVVDLGVPAATIAALVAPPTSPSAPA